MSIWPDYQGYGFNLQSEKTKPGQYIGSVDPQSPAEVGGLRPDDRIFEVNEQNVTDCKHREVVKHIKTYPNQVELLVADRVAEIFYTSRGVNITSELSNIERISCPAVRPGEIYKCGNSFLRISVIPQGEKTLRREPMTSG